jgi:hypothetical protein
MSNTPETEMNFGDRVEIEMLRYGVPNEMYTHKVINSFKSNAWVTVPVKYPPIPEIHSESCGVVSVISEGVKEDTIYVVREKDCKLIYSVQAEKEKALRDLVEDIKRLPMSRERVFGKDRKGKEGAVGIEYHYLVGVIDGAIARALGGEK